MGELEEARSLAERALLTATEEQGPGSHDSIDALLVLGRLDQDLGRYSDAERTFREALSAAEARPDAGGDRLLVRSMTAVATLHRIQGRYADAEALFRRGLELAESAFGAESREVADLCNGLAIVFKYSGRFDEGDRLYRRALDIFEIGRAHV